MQHVIPSPAPLAIFHGAKYPQDGYYAIRKQFPCEVIAYWNGAHYVFSDYSEYGAWRIATKRKPAPVAPTETHANICHPYGIPVTEKKRIRVAALSRLI